MRRLCAVSGETSPPPATPIAPAWASRPTACAAAFDRAAQDLTTESGGSDLPWDSGSPFNPNEEMTMSRTLSAPVGAHAIARPARTRRLAAVLQSWWAAYQRRQRERLTIEQLHGMSDRELKDIGIVRSQIEYAVGRDADRVPRRDLGL
jgi:uncharacterized protein YjiS (DUF1127 family)